MNLRQLSSRWKNQPKPLPTSPLLRRKKTKKGRHPSALPKTFDICKFVLLRGPIGEMLHRFTTFGFFFPGEYFAPRIQIWNKKQNSSVQCACPPLYASLLGLSEVRKSLSCGRKRGPMVEGEILVHRKRNYENLDRRREPIREDSHGNHMR